MIMKKIINKLKWYKKSLKGSVIESWYTYCLENMQIENNSILFQSRYGEDFGGNIFYILKEFNDKYPSFKLYLAYKKSKKEMYKNLLANYNINNVVLVELHKSKYWCLLATCKYLVNDVTFHTAFIKREGQIYLNTWHGVPLKKMGLEEENKGYLFGNMQRNFLAADYLLFSSEYMTKTMIRAYSLDNLFLGKIINMGYPRNAVFFNDTRRNIIREELKVVDKHVLVYMPTWREFKSKEEKEKNNKLFIKSLKEIDSKLKSNQILYLKLHPLAKSLVDFNDVKNIVPFPSQYETYDFLNIADCLITDYSSVMFDFVCTFRNIILFTYDFEEYFNNRGLYIDINELPFHHVKNVNELIKAIDKKIYYRNNNFIYDLTKNENIYSTSKICKELIENKLLDYKKIEVNNKDNIYIYVDMMVKNGITSSASSLINSIDSLGKNYFVIFRQTGSKNNFSFIKNLPSGIGVMAITTIERTLSELIASFIYYKFNITNHIIEKILENSYDRTFNKYYGHIPNGTFIQYVGYGRDPLHIFMHASRKIVYVHNDMKKELKKNNVQHENTLITCYQNYNKVVCVSEASWRIASEIGKNKGNYTIVHNCFDYKNIIEKSNAPIAFDSDTIYISNDGKEINDILNDDEDKFITIGRFSPEKQHRRLLDAFELYYMNNRNCRLIIIGGYGVLYNDTVAYSKTLKCKNNVTIIKSLSNPMPILKRCDLFILSSSHEGLPVVFFEADCLGKPILSTNIEGPREFFEKYKGGLLVEEDAEAIYKGMLEFKKGNVRPLNIDMFSYNQKCISEFEGILHEKN